MRHYTRCMENELIIEQLPENQFERVSRCAHGWNSQYPDGWRARREAAGFTALEIQEAAVLGHARSEMYLSLCRAYGDPAYGGGGYTTERRDEEILKLVDSEGKGLARWSPLAPGHPFLKAADIIRRKS